MKHWKSLAVILSAAIFVFALATFLPAGTDLRLAVCWLGYEPLDLQAAPGWGYLVRLVGWALPKSLLTVGLSSLSMAAALICVALVACSAEAFMRQSLALAEENDIAPETGSFPLAGCAAALTALAFAVTPAFWLAATRCSPVMVALVFPLGALALAFRLSDGSRGKETEDDRPRRTNPLTVLLIGFLAGVGCLHGPAGLTFAALPLMALWLPSVRREVGVGEMSAAFLIGAAMGVGTIAAFGESPVSDLQRLLSWSVWMVRSDFAVSGILSFAAFGFLPLLMLFDFTRRGLTRTRRAQGVFLVSWGLAVVALGAGVVWCGVLARGRAADLFVRTVMADLGERRWLIADGAVGDLMHCLKPERVRFVSLAGDRDADRTRQLVDWAADIPDADDDLLFSAELGPVAFTEEWFTRFETATNQAATCILRFVQPSEAWAAHWDALKPYLADPKEPCRGYLKRYFGAQGNAQAAVRQERGDREGAWRDYWRVLDEVDEDNVSAMLNLSELIETGYPATDEEKARVKDLRRAMLARIPDARVMRQAMAICGRVYAAPERIESVLARHRQKSAERQESPFARRMREAIGKLRQASALQGDERRLAIADIENSVLPGLKQSAGDLGKWTVEHYRGAMFTLMGPEYRRRARESLWAAFRNETSSGVGEVACELLEIDLQSGDLKCIESDAREILRRDRRHKMANAVMGALRLKEGELEGASRFLLRALAEDDPPPGALNDMACVLLRKGDAALAETYARKAVGLKPDDWNMRETLVQALIARDKFDEADKELANAEKLAIDAVQLPRARTTLDAARERLRTKRDNR